MFSKINWTMVKNNATVDDIMTWKHFPHYQPFVRVNHHCCPNQLINYLLWSQPDCVIGISAATSGRATAGTTRAVPDCSTNHSSADRISGQFLFYHAHSFTKSMGNLRFRRLVPLFVPIGVCVTMHDDGTASDVTIGMWRHNQQATNHERNGKPGFSFPK